jgi:hypothetical protein
VIHRCWFQSQLNFFTRVQGLPTDRNFSENGALLHTIYKYTAL